MLTLNNFNIRRLLLNCQIYDSDQIDKILDTLSEFNIDEHQDEFLDILAKNALLTINRDISKEIKVMKEMFTSKLAIVPLIFGIRNSNKSSVVIDLSHYLNIPNVVSTNTVKETLRIYHGKISNILESDDFSFSNYLIDSREITKGIQVDIEKAIKQGKSIILCGHNLFLPYIFELHSNGLFPAPVIINEEEEDSENGPFPLYYLPSNNEDSISLLFIPILLKADMKKSRIKPETRDFLQTLQDEIIANTVNNMINWPVHVVSHDPEIPQKTSRIIHQIIIKTLKKAIHPT
ncbi:phosphoglycerate kinase involved in diphosphoglycerate synthesis [Cryptosporidium sp. chipmunk genotype I]|uniref:phosphoglycerate kinase involved in diphosphoglycerate synthesis n=1 Tax=Cryptosporidium sp. chipmunk genotype I TaxID=1280935 RepID=UPI00351A864F|nr:phosphoglycerate kinase involved in diphosphoglycerate synthesis [Cryptosporidium sp. chipmunk genotype I]